MAKAPDPNNYVKRTPSGIWAVFWKSELHSYHNTLKQASIVLWKLKKLQKATGAEPIPLSRLDRVIQDNLLESLGGIVPTRTPKRSMGGLTCPDCGALMYLRTGRFGLFYGCENYSKTLCRGSVSADAHGVPVGVPVDSATRRARYLLKTALMEFPVDSFLVFNCSNINGTGVHHFSLEQCRKYIARMCKDHPELVETLHHVPDHLQRTRLERILTDHDPLDEMMGPIGVDLENP